VIWHPRWHESVDNIMQDRNVYNGPIRFHILNIGGLSVVMVKFGLLYPTYKTT
jgi:hypothetical protein